MKFEMLSKENFDLWQNFVKAVWPCGPKDDCFDIDYSYDFVTRPLEELEGKVMMVMENGLCVGYFGKSVTVGMPTFSMGEFLKGKMIPSLEALKAKYPDALMYYSQYYDEQQALDKCGYESVDNTSTFVDEYGHPYHFPSLYHFVTAGDKKALASKLEKIVFPEVNGDISYDVMDGKELMEFVHKNSPLPYGEAVVWSDSCNRSNFPGFRYLNYNNIHTGLKDVRYLVAHHEETLVGVICYGVWPYSQDHQSLSFIDVAIPYRKRGIATQMIRELNNYLLEGKDLHLSPVSDMGEACNIAQIFKRFITSVKVLSYEEMRGY